MMEVVGEAARGAIVRRSLGAKTILVEATVELVGSCCRFLVDSKCVVGYVKVVAGVVVDSN